MNIQICSVVLLPFIGTALGAGGVFFLKGELRRNMQRVLLGFAAGVMTAASVWSLIMPAMEQASHMGRAAFVPACAGIWGGFLFLLMLDEIVPHIHAIGDKAEGISCEIGKNTMMVFAVTLHNLPEGMAVGIAAADWLSGSESISFASALTLAIGIAIQNMPEGAIISLPLKNNGMKKEKAFWCGVLSGAVEPVGAVITILLAGLFVPVLPYLLAFAAGAMLYVVVDELIPQMSSGEHSNIGTIFFAAGFTLMMVLDVTLG